MLSNASGPLLLLLLATPLAGQSASGVAPGEVMNAPGAALARAADADADGEVTADEWSGLLERLGGADGGPLSSRRVAAAALRPLLDADGDGDFDAADVAARLAAVDADGSGVLDRAELEATFGRGGSLLDGLIAFGLDADGNLEVSAEEWAAGAGRPNEPEAPAPDEALSGWFEVAERYVPEDRGAIAPSVFLVTVQAGLDLDRNGRLDRADLEAHFAALDLDGDGKLSAAELSAAAATASEGPRPRPFVPDALPESPREPRMPWQRSLDDALALSKSTGKPLLICVNVDGEAASESLARGRYTDPEFARLASGFVPLLASPDRHSDRDHDGRGARVPDPRFGRVICREHQEVEPLLFERYFNGNRVAPRHVGVSPEGEILFDIFLVNDLSIIDRALEQHGNFETALPDPTTLDLAGLLASPDAAARTLLEARFEGTGDEAERVRLAALALDPAAPVKHPAVVRLALRDDARAVVGQALASIAGAVEALPLDLAPDALRAAAGVPERRPQLAAAFLRRAAVEEGDTAVRWRRMGRIAAAVELDSETVDLAAWRAAVAGAVAAPRPAHGSIETMLEALDGIGQRRKREPDDPRLDALFARTALRAARAQIEAGEGNPGFLLEDSRAAAERAAAALPDDPAVQAVMASTAHLLGDFAVAREASARALPGLIGFAELELAAEMLNVFADTRVRGLYERLNTDEGWPEVWVADVLAAYEVLLLHPHGTEEQVRAGLDAMGELQLHAEQDDYLRRALERFPTSPDLHRYLRWQALRDGDVDDLAAVYEQAEVPEWARASWVWYAGLGYLVAAEREVADGDGDGAIDAYRSSVERFDESIEREPQFGDSALHYVGLAWSGVARVHLERGDLEGAIAALEASADANSAGFGNPDGLGNTPHAVARALLQVLRRTDREDEAAELGRYLADRGVDI